MTTILLPNAKARFFDTNGVPLVGGKVYTYEAGTSTPKTTYTDYSGLTANTNPVILDSAGEADIWLSNGLYKITVNDANGVLQWTTDNVGNIASAATDAAGFGIATNIASAAGVDLGTITSHFGNITGATNISSFGSSASINAPIYLIKFNGALNLIYSANLITPTGANITTAANDRAWVEYLGSGAWRIFAYEKADGTPANYGTVPVANGGTGATTSAVARTNLAIVSGASFKNLNIKNDSVTPNTKMTVTADVAVIPDVNGNAVRATSVSLTINAATTGANALDTGSLTTNTWYYIYIISDGTTTAGLMSASATTPTLPIGYVYYARCGAVNTDGSSIFKRIKQIGNKAQYTVTSGSNTANLPIMASGSAGSTSTPTWASVAVSSYVPTAVARSITGVLHAIGSPTNTMAAPNNAYGAVNSTSNPPPVVANTPGSNGPTAVNFDFVLESSNIYWACDTANDRLTCTGWIDNI